MVEVTSSNVYMLYASLISVFSVGGDNRERSGGTGVRDGPVVGDPDVPREGTHGRPQPRHPAVQGQAPPRRGHRHPVAGK